MSRRITESIVEECKDFINAGKLEELQEYVRDLFSSEFEAQPDWPNLFQKVYLHACLKKQKEIAEWITSLFSMFDPITQIAYRQVFFYGRYLLAKA
jgi:hypothetical protein